jgi:transposase
MKTAKVFPAVLADAPTRPKTRFAAREARDRSCGVDLTQMPGFQSDTALVLLGELGPDFAERFPTAKHSGSWLGLCPDNRITGGGNHKFEHPRRAEPGGDRLAPGCARIEPGAERFG